MLPLLGQDMGDNQGVFAARDPYEQTVPRGQHLVSGQRLRSFSMYFFENVHKNSLFPARTAQARRFFIVWTNADDKRISISP